MCISLLSQLGGEKLELLSLTLTDIDVFDITPDPLDVVLALFCVFPLQLHSTHIALAPSQLSESAFAWGRN